MQNKDKAVSIPEAANEIFKNGKPNKPGKEKKRDKIIVKAINKAQKHIL